MTEERFDAAPILAGLKDFQRASVDHAFNRLYEQADPTMKFLVADEVGLGKTMVARGLIAKTVEHLWDSVPRIDVVYICSNRTIAEQNIQRLNIMGEQGFSFSSRMTMIAKEVSALRGRKVNFISFTPGTSFDLKSSLGMSDERVLIWMILRRLWGEDLLRRLGARRIFQGWMGSVKRFDDQARGQARWEEELDSEMVSTFGAELATTSLHDRFRKLVEHFDHGEPSELALSARAEFVGELRNRLASQCVSALEPDLVILDEFQRFRDLLSGESEAGALANDLFDYPGNRTLLLSATPYKMYTASGEEEDDDHHRDFLNTVGFLLANDHQRFEGALRRFRELLLDVGRVGPATLHEARSAVEDELRRVMVRTERLAVGEDRNGMLCEVSNRVGGLTADDVRSFVALERLSLHVDGGSMTEYWKSAPFFLNFTDGYKFDGRLEAALADPTRNDETAALCEAVGGQIDWERWRNYDALDGGNPRLRQLIADTSGAGRWRMLWLAPSMPDYELAGPWAESGSSEFTKRLIFSAWAAVPKAIASLVSYDAERQIMGLRPGPTANDPEQRKKIKGLLQFKRSPSGGPGGMSAFGLVYPSWALAELGDPRDVAQQLGRRPTLEEVGAFVSERIEQALEALPAAPVEGRVDERWYWAAPILFDVNDERARRMGFKGLDLYAWLGGGGDYDAELEATAFAEHVALAHQVYRGEVTLGRRPEDLTEVLTLHVLGNPATLALRALRTVLGDAEPRWCWDGACRIAWGFRTLFNLPEASTLIRSLRSEERYWQEVLQYAANGGLGAVLDEYLHVLREWLGLLGDIDWRQVERLTAEVAAAVSLKASDYVARDHVGSSGQRDHRFHSRFALRFGNERSETDGSVVRAGLVRTAFNSPFWPFVLASTSVGQEGLDFHLYCHAIVHWNLPSNPVDMEQREGRVHRFKGHAIRRNIAAKYEDRVRGLPGDRWDSAFAFAVEDRPTGENDLVPYWVFPGPAAIERHVQALPLSREVGQLEDLKRSTALYRLVFGQPRQDDLLAYLSGVDDQAILDELRIDLSPQP